MEKNYAARIGMNKLLLNNLQAFTDDIYIVNISSGKQVKSVKMYVRH